MKRIVTTLLTLAAVAALSIGPSFAAAKGGCCDTGSCCDKACCKGKHHKA